MHVIEGLGVRCLPSRSASTHAESTRASANKNFESRAKDIHSGTRASGVRSQGFSAQLAGESCGVIGVGDCYPVHHTRNKPQRYPQQSHGWSKGSPRFGSPLSGAIRILIISVCRSDGGDASCFLGIFDKLSTHFLGVYSAETL